MSPRSQGTSADVLLSVLSNGLNERFSGSNAGTAFGEGVYLAEDVGLASATRTHRTFVPPASLEAQ